MTTSLLSLRLLRAIDDQECLPSLPSLTYLFRGFLYDVEDRVEALHSEGLLDFGARGRLVITKKGRDELAAEVENHGVVRGGHSFKSS